MGSSLPVSHMQSDASDDEKNELALLQSQLEIQGMPKYSRPETFDEKLYRKFSEQPLIPIGCATTAYFLASGIKSFYNRDAAKSQRMMRARVGAQFATIMIFIGYYGFNSFNLNVAPGYHPTRAKNEEKDQK